MKPWYVLACWIALVWGATAVAAPQTGGPLPPQHQATAAIAAEIISYHVAITLGAPYRLTKTQRAVIQVHDPQAFPNGVPVPVGFDRVSDQGAQVIERGLVLPPTTAPGTKFTLQNTIRERAPTRGGLSGVFMTVPELPCKHAELSIQSTGRTPLSVWTDPNGNPRTRGGSKPSIHIVWNNIPAFEPAQAVWTSYTSWEHAGQALTSAVAQKLATNTQMGPDVAADLVNSSVPSIIERVQQRIRPIEYPGASWATARPATDVLQSKSGNAFERGVVLMSLLSAAGYQVAPGMYRPASALGAAPTSLPAPSVFTKPVVVIQEDQKTTFIDPASLQVAYPTLPANMVGALVWQAGDVPAGVATHHIGSGQVTISGRLTVELNGKSTLNATITATGLAEQWLRENLTPLTPSDRERAFRGMMRTGWNTLQGFTFVGSGIETTLRPLKITVQATVSTPLAPVGPGFSVPIAPLLGPRMAAWFPPGTRIHDQLTLRLPETADILAAQYPAVAHHPAVQLTQTLVLSAGEPSLVTQVYRPVNSLTPQQQGSQWLIEQASFGPTLVCFAGTTKDIAKGLRKNRQLPVVERKVLEYLLWSGRDQPIKAYKAAQSAFKEVSFQEWLQVLDRYALPDDPRPWLGAWEAARTDHEGLLAVRALENHRAADEAWKRAATLSQSERADVRVDALLLMERLQRPQVNSLWRDPLELLQEAQEAAQAFQASQAGAPSDPQPAVQPDPRILLRQADHALQRSDLTTAESLLTTARPLTNDPTADLLFAELGSLTGLAADTVVERLNHALNKKPPRASGLLLAARTAQTINRPDLAYYYTLSATRIAPHNPQVWSQLVQASLAYGDLPGALYAAKQASDRAPTDPSYAKQLSQMATLMGHAQWVQQAHQRMGKTAVLTAWPPTLETLMEQVPQNGLLALLRHYNAETTHSPLFLALRAQLELDANHRQNAARDATLLAHRHQDPAGVAMAFSASAGLIWSSAGDRHLSDAADSNTTARAIRMEHRLLMAGGNPLTDAKALSGEPRAQLITQASTQPASLLAEMPDWPSGLANPTASTPAGFVQNRLLSTTQGVRAWSDPSRNLTIVRMAVPTQGLPPLLSLLYTQSDSPLQSLPQSGQVVRLHGGPIPLFAASRVGNEQTVIGLGYTRQASIRALELAGGI